MADDFTYTRNGHGQNGWSPVGCEGLYSHAMCNNSVSGWSPIDHEDLHTNLNIPSPISLRLVLSVTHMHLLASNWLQSLASRKPTNVYPSQTCDAFHHAKPPRTKPRPHEVLGGDRQAHPFQVAGRKLQISQQLGARAAAALQRPAVLLSGAGDEGHLKERLRDSNGNQF